MPNISCDAILAPAEYQNLAAKDLSRTTCVVFDILRATSTMVTALANGAAGIVPVSEISEALAMKNQHPDWLLAGERHGLRITADLTGGIDFDLGNSPREFTREKIEGKTIVATTTNGTRALKACQGAHKIWVGSFLNLSATAAGIAKESPEDLLLVCAGTADQAALEDVLAAGALSCLLSSTLPNLEKSDAVHLAAIVYQKYEHDLPQAMAAARNGKRLLSIPELRDDIPLCLRRDLYQFAATYGSDGMIR